MIVMFILMVAPVLAIPVFWLLPIGQAIAVYLIALALSGSMFWLMRGNHKRPVKTGKESLIGRDARIMARSSNGSHPKYTLMIEGELWTARSSDILKPDESAVITGSEGNTLIVERKDGATGLGPVNTRKEGTLP
jgi:membrane protein implicated in regulation of membrane protease activity